MSMQYISTRGKTEPMSFSDAVLTGLAPDGGLLIPAEIPDFSDLLNESLPTYPELAKRIFAAFVDFPPDVLEQLVDASYASFDTPEVAPLRTLGETHILELFHGPTLAFKDVAMQWLSQCFEYILEKRGEELNVLGSTSGDTGSAAIYGLRSKKNVRVFMMHPKGRCSLTQERQMTSVLDDNVFNLAVEGTFDDCQHMMKALFADVEFKKQYKLGAVNSVNWCRILAQIVYYFYAGLKLMQEQKVDQVNFAVPTGNFGNILAGFLRQTNGLAY